MNRSQRLKTIKDIISSKKISSQEELMKELTGRGHEITQSTVSRDISHLRLSKIRNHKDEEYYTIKNKYSGEAIFDSNRLRSKFQENVLSIAEANNIIVVKTYPGEAQGTAAVIDGMNFIEILGTVAGDDSIICVIDSNANAKKISRLLHAL